MIGEHNCPRCGTRTAGAFSVGGLRWAICDDCMSRDRARSLTDPIEDDLSNDFDADELGIDPEEEWDA